MYISPVGLFSDKVIVIKFHFSLFFFVCFIPASSHNEMIEATQAYGIDDPSAEETEPPAQVHQISTV